METVRPASSYKQNRRPKGGLKQYLFAWLRLTDGPAVKIYRSYGNDTMLTVQGSVFQRNALPRVNYRKSTFVNLLGVLRLFLVKPIPDAHVRVLVNGQSIETTTATDGYFRVDLPLAEPLSAGWYPVRATLLTGPDAVVGEGTVMIPHRTALACISDIDDTFLVSHSATLLKRLEVLLTNNAHTRKPFEGVVTHYQLLASAGVSQGAINPFFYVSSSEWNLYDYILAFSEKNGLPDGVYMLSGLKQFSEVLKTGQNKHRTKFARIVRILETYPQQRFVLLGDDTQEDPVIYASVVEYFPEQIRCVYIRQIHAKNRPKAQQALERISVVNVPYCYFVHSAEARQHSIDIGLAS